MGRKKILVFIDWYLPGYKAGGPIRSVANIVSSLRNDFDFWVFTRNCDLGETIPYENIISDKWTDHPDGYKIFYASPQHLGFRNIKKIIYAAKADIHYINGIYSFWFNIAPLLLLKSGKKNSGIIVSPRGMLSKGALLLKANKKWLFLFFSKAFGLFKNVLWHASSVFEQKEITDMFGQVNLVIAPNISVNGNASIKIKEKKKGEARFFFLSRVSRVKNLLFAFEILKSIKEGNVEFDVYGPIEDQNYWTECNKVIATLGKNIKVNYRGPLVENKTEVLSGYHFMLFPTMNENYGHSIFEAFSAGCPVIISDQTPWKNLAQKQIGWEIALQDKTGFLQVIEQCVQMDQQSYLILSGKAYEFASAISNNKQVIEQNRQLFLT